MTLLQPERAQQLAHRALQLAGGADLEVTLEAREHELNRFTADHSVQNLVRSTAQLSVRVQCEGRQGRASTGTLTDEAIGRTVERALAAARQSPPPPDGLPALSPGAPVAVRGLQPPEPDPEATARAVAVMAGRCRAEGCRAAGIVENVGQLLLVANTAGLSVWDHDTTAQFSLSAFREEGAGWSRQLGASARALDAEAVAATAVGKALASRAPAPLPPGRYTVVLEPAAVSSLLLFAATAGFGAQQVQEGSSFLAGRLGKRVFGANIDIADDCRHPLSVGPVFDGEGLPRQRVGLVERGVARAVVHDRLTAARDGCASTGHGRSQPSADGPLAANLVLSPGGATRDELIAGTERGLLITQFHYSNVVEPSQLTLTGMTRNGTFLIERGEVVGPVRNARYTQSVVAALQHVTGIGNDAALASALFGGNVVVPSLRIEDFCLSSATDF